MRAKLITLLTALQTQAALQTLTVTLTHDESTLTIAGADILAELMDRYGERNVHYAAGLYQTAEAAVLAQWTRLITDKQSDLNKIYAAMLVDYSALDDYAETRTEEVTHGHIEETEHGHTVTDSGTKTRELEYDSTMQHDVTPFDTNSFQAEGKDVHSGLDTSTTTDDLTHTHSGTDTLTHSGTDTTQTGVSGFRSAPAGRIRQEVDLRLSVDLMDMIIDLYARRFLFY